LIATQPAARKIVASEFNAALTAGRKLRSTAPAGPLRRISRM